MFDWFAKVPLPGLIVIALVAVLVFILIFFGGLRMGKGEWFINVGRAVDKKISKLEEKLQKEKDATRHDEKIREKLYRFSLIVDEKLKADLKRLVRNMDAEIAAMFASYMKCDFPALRIADEIRNELNQRIDENCLREKLSVTEKAEYLKEIKQEIESRYYAFLGRFETASCGEKYPAWTTIEESVDILLFSWQGKTIAIIEKRINEKIAYYKAERANLQLPEYQKNNVDDPVEKNEGYLASFHEINVA